MILVSSNAAPLDTTVPGDVCPLFNETNNKKEVYKRCYYGAESSGVGAVGPCISRGGGPIGTVPLAT